MSYEAEWRKEWEVLRAERALARQRWRTAADGIAERAHDPFGLGKLVQDHPVAAAGIGAAAGALIAKLFLGRRGAPRGDASQRNGASHGDPSERPASTWTTILRDAALGVAVPWLLRLLQEKLGRDLDADDVQGTATADTPSAAPAAETVAGTA